MSQKLADYLVQQGMLPREKVDQVSRGLAYPHESPIGEMIRMKLINDEKLARWLAQRFSLQFINPAMVRIDDQARNRVPEGLMEEFPCLPIDVRGDLLVIAIADPLVLPEIADALDSIKGRVEFVLTTFTRIWDAYRAEITDLGFFSSYQEVGEKTGLTEF